MGGRRSGRKRSSTFSNVVSLEPHGEDPSRGVGASELGHGQRPLDIINNNSNSTVPTDSQPNINGNSNVNANAPVTRPASFSFRPMNFGGSSHPDRRPSYMQITGDSYHAIDDSELDPDEPLLGGERELGGMGMGIGMSESVEAPQSRHMYSRSRSYFDTTDLMDHRFSVATGKTQKRNSRAQRPSLPQKKSSVARWLENTSRPNHRNYSSINNPDESELAIDLGNVGSDSDDVMAFPSHTNTMPPLRVGSPETISSAPNSKPSTRRGSSSSSLNDVCYPIDSAHEVDSTLGDTKMWPDLNVLNEFAEEEMKDYVALTRHSVEDGTGDRATSPFILGGTISQAGGGISTTAHQGRYSVNEVNMEAPGARLRPQRIVPWNGVATKDQQSLQRSFSIPGVDEKNALDYRFTYFREDMDATIHSPTISGLLQPDQSFATLFPPKVYSRYSPEDANHMRSTPEDTVSDLGGAGSKRAMAAAMAGEKLAGAMGNTLHANGGNISSTASECPDRTEKEKIDPSVQQRRPSASPAPEPIPFWLDIMNPTEEEMKVISKAFGIHPLTTEDIFLGETREKVELFRNYYLVCFRSIDINVKTESERFQERHQSTCPMNVDMNGNSTGVANNAVGSNYPSLASMMRRTVSTGSGQSMRPAMKPSSKSKSLKRQQNELKPLNMYIVVFHEGVLTFHFAPTLHTVNVRRRARLLRDYITVSSDWISYALIDDITDAFAPMIDAIEDEVNVIEDSILNMNSGSDSSDSDSDTEDWLDDKKSRSTISTASSTSCRSSMLTSSQKWKRKGDMLRTIGETRKRVMSLLRLLGSKADVIRGFAKRCNERWEVAPRNEIGLYLGDIQDHIVTMVQSLNHYEKLLARSHSNYLAQINIDMTKVNNDTNDVLGKITVLGTIVLPMNIVTGLWGMNVLVPGQGREDLVWFWSIVLTMIIFVVIGFIVARRVYKI